MSQVYALPCLPFQVSFHELICRFAEWLAQLRVLATLRSRCLKADRADPGYVIVFEKQLRNLTRNKV